MSASKKSTYQVFTLTSVGGKFGCSAELYNKQHAIALRNKFRKARPLDVFEVYKIEKI